MADDPIRSYLDAKKHCDQAFATLGRLSQIIIQVAGAFQTNPRQFSFSNTVTGLPITVPHSGVDANKWLPAEDVQRALSACHRAEIDLNTAWATVPDRTGLQPPGDPWGTLRSDSTKGRYVR
jgi:hypothetical protein